MDRDSPETWNRETLLRVMRRAIHDLAEPVRGMSTVLAMIQDPEMPEDERRDLLDMAGIAATRATDLLAGLRHFVAALEDPLDCGPVDLAPLCATVWSDVGGGAGDLSCDVDLRVQADATALAQVLAELFRNVLAHGGGCAHVTAHAEDGWGVILVRDRGPGLDHDQAQAVFAPFHRLRPKSEIEGAGLGLSVARALVTRMGGQIRIIAADEGGGVRVDLPLPGAAIGDDRGQN